MCTLYCEAQNVLLFNSKQGLSNSCTNYIYEDSRHNIWFATQNGLNRYDGVKINVYYHNDKDSTSLLNDEVTYVMEYDKDNIIVASGSGLQIYNYPTDKFTTLPFVGINNDTIKVRFADISKVTIDGKERVFACFSGYGNAELLRDSKGKFSIEHITEFNVSGCTNPNSFIQDNGNRIWVIDSNRNIIQYKKKGSKRYKEITKVVKMCVSQFGNLYAATSDNGLYIYNVKADRFDQVATAKELGGPVYGLRKWNGSRLFICTDGGGLRVYSEETKKVTESLIKINNFNLATSNVKDALCDSYENVWASIYWKGIMMKPHSKSAFDYIGQNSITKNSIGTNSVFAISPADKNHMWVATDNDGLYLMNNDGSLSSHVITDQKAGTPAAFTYIYSPIVGGGNTRSLDSNILLGTYMEGLWQLKGNSISLVTKDINQIFEIQPADKGNVWISTMGNGIYYFDTHTQEYKHYTSDWSKGAEGVKIIGNPFVYTILQHAKLLFVGTADGMHICKYDGNGILKEKSTKLLNTITVKHFALSPDKKYIWAATTNGLYRIDIKSKESKRYTTSEGLANNSVKSVYAEESHIWVATDNGLSCLNTKTEQFTNFFTEDGIQDTEFNRGTIIKHEGKLFIGGISGITYFKPNTIINQAATNNKISIRLVDILIGGNKIHVNEESRDYEILSDVLNDCAELNLSHKDNHFILELCVEGIINQHVTFEYSIDGSDWINQGDGTRLIFDNLKAGKHKILIRAQAFNLTSEERELIVNVDPIWYASWWAKLIYLLATILIAVLLHSYAKRQIEARRLILRNKQQEEINEARIQFFMNLSHEIRTPMTLILAPIEKLLRMDKDEECKRNYNLIKQNANRILRLINQMMDVRKIEQGKYQLDYHRVDIVALMQNGFDVFTNQAENRNIKYTFEHEGINSLQTFVDPDNIDKIIMNLLSNAFKFTPDGGEINMKLSTNTNDKEQKNFNISVTDTGVGIDDEGKKKVFDRFYSAGHENGYIGTGIGLNLTAMIVDLHQGKIEVVDNPTCQGTQFNITIPINAINAKSTIEDNDKEESPLIIPTEIQAPIDHSNEGEETIQKNEFDKNNSTLVLVEDDSSIRQYVHTEMSADLNVVDFGDGQQAWDYILAHPTDVQLVISDIMMPVMDGLTLCQKLKSNFNTNHIPILLMTALGSDSDRIAGITNGADAYVSKPFNIDVLHSTALGLLHNRQLLQGRFKAEKLQEESIEKVELESPDENLMRRIMKVINDNLDNEELSVEMIADLVGISRVHFYRKMKDMTGQSPREFVKYIRLKEAARLLSTKKMDIYSVSIACGFKSASSFSTYFKNLYGVSPSEFVKKQMSTEEK